MGKNPSSQIISENESIVSSMTVQQKQQQVQLEESKFQGFEFTNDDDGFLNDLKDSDHALPNTILQSNVEEVHSASFLRHQDNNNNNNNKGEIETLSKSIQMNSQPLASKSSTLSTSINIASSDAPGIMHNKKKRIQEILESIPDLSYLDNNLTFSESQFEGF